MSDAAGVTQAGRPGLARRLWRYQAERFALAGFVPLITAFAFSSACYSRLVRGEAGFIPWTRFAVGAFTAIVFFFWLRVLDEHKDADVDARYRPELPVPRGLVTLAELRVAGLVVLVAAALLNAVVAPILLLPWLVIAGWAALMTKEFFVRGWLRAHVTAYLLTHMAIMPLIDAYTTGLDWLAEGAHAPGGLYLFLAVTFFNGILIEVGRKIRPPAGEREGVDTYTRAWGLRAAPAIWMGVLALSGLTAWAAARQVAAASAALPGPVLPLTVVALALAGAGLTCTVPAALFLRQPSGRKARAIEAASSAWPFVTYLLLGSGPYLVRALAAGAGR